MTAASPELLTRSQIARDYLSCDPNTAEKMADDGRIPPPIDLTPDGPKRMLRWRKADMDAWLAKGCPAVTATTE